jgi:RNA polymerase sigma-70 factor (ECF subfamily)
LRAATRRQGFRPHHPGALRSWVFRIARNLCHDHNRRRRRGPISMDPSELPAAPSPARSEDRLVWCVVDQLSPPLRGALLLRMRYGFSYDEVARVLGCRQGTARWRVHEGLRQLGEMMSDE